MGQIQHWIGVTAMLYGMSAVAAPPQPETADAYAPIFLMYSGEPSPERMQALRQFLAANNTPKQVAKEAVDTVTYKLKMFKAGFAYPVFFSDHSSEGNACVVADSHHSHTTPAITLLTNPRIHRFVLGGHTPALEVKSILDTVLNHEIFHCYDLMRQTQTEIGEQLARHGSPYFSYWSETGADAFAALQHLRSGGNKQLIRQIRDFRTLNLLNGDALHYTARTLDHILWNYDQKRLSRLNMRQLVELAYAIREQTALTPEEFALADLVAGRLEGELKALTGEGDSHPNLGWLQTLQYYVPDAEYFSQFMLQVRSALHNLGGDISSTNVYFHPLLKKYHRASHFRVEKAEAVQAGKGKQ